MSGTGWRTTRGVAPPASPGTLPTPRRMVAGRPPRSPRTPSVAQAAGRSQARTAADPSPQAESFPHVNPAHRRGQAAEAGPRTPGPAADRAGHRSFDGRREAGDNQSGGIMAGVSRSRRRGTEPDFFRNAGPGRSNPDGRRKGRPVRAESSGFSPWMREGHRPRPRASVRLAGNRRRPGNQIAGASNTRLTRPLSGWMRGST